MEKTISLLLIIGLGLILQKKVSSKEQLKGLKVLILSVALPATIFAALLNVKVDAEMLLLPLFGLLINAVLLGAFYLLFRKSLAIGKSKKRTLSMLMPSLAPGLSCFPFIAEYLGEQPLAMAALADVGNKVFVLILLYLLAMHWYQSNRMLSGEDKKENRLKDLLISLGKEPINMVIIVALVLLFFGVNMEALPTAISSSLMRLTAMMTPLVLLFIGMAVKIKKHDASLIMRMLVLRSGLAFLLSAALMLAIPGLSSSLILLTLVFAQSSASFWPFAHINVVNDLEGEQQHKTFDANFALSILALSLPFSTMVILTIFSFPSITVSPVYSVVIGTALIMAFLCGPIYSWVKGQFAMKQGELEVS